MINIDKMSIFFTVDALDASASESEIIQQLLLRMRAPVGVIPKFDPSILDDYLTFGDKFNPKMTT